LVAQLAKMLARVSPSSKAAFLDGRAIEVGRKSHLRVLHGGATTRRFRPPRARPRILLKLILNFYRGWVNEGTVRLAQERLARMSQ
jgi:hypothetical protein